MRYRFIRKVNSNLGKNFLVEFASIETPISQKIVPNHDEEQNLRELCI